MMRLAASNYHATTKRAAGLTSRRFSSFGLTLPSCCLDGALGHAALLPRWRGQGNNLSETGKRPERLRSGLRRKRKNQNKSGPKYLLVARLIFCDNLRSSSGKH
jgi:hypothetical protein